MGNGASTDQGSRPTHGTRDVGDTVDTEQFDWSQLAEAPIAKQPSTLFSTDPDSYNGAQLRGQKMGTFHPTDDNTQRMGPSSSSSGMHADSYSDAQLRNRKPTKGCSSSTEDNTHSGAYNGA